MQQDYGWAVAPVHDQQLASTARPRSIASESSGSVQAHRIHDQTGELDH